MLMNEVVIISLESISPEGAMPILKLQTELKTDRIPSNSQRLFHVDAFSETFPKSHFRHGKSASSGTGLFIMSKSDKNSFGFDASYQRPQHIRDGLQRILESPLRDKPFLSTHWTELRRPHYLSAFCLGTSASSHARYYFPFRSNCPR